jgi:hypothetical protein
MLRFLSAFAISFILSAAWGFGAHSIVIFAVLFMIVNLIGRNRN